VRTGHAVILEQGDLVSALLSSGALPGAWPPVSHNDDTLVEGGLVANVPLVQAHHHDGEPWTPPAIDVLTGNSARDTRRPRRE